MYKKLSKNLSEIISQHNKNITPFVYSMRVCACTKVCENSHVISFARPASRYSFYCYKWTIIAYVYNSLTVRFIICFSLFSYFPKSVTRST